MQKALLWLAAGLVLAVPLAAAQSSSPAPPPGGAPGVPTSWDLLKDNSDDVALSPAGQASEPLPAGSAGFLDLVSLKGLEAPDTLTFTLGLASLTPPSDAPGATSAFYIVQFQVHDTVYAVAMFRSTFQGQGASYFAELQVQDPNSLRFTSLVGLPVTVDLGANTLTVNVPRQSLQDGHGAAPFPGMPIDGFRARSGAITDMFNPVGRLPKVAGAGASRPMSIADAMPDNGNGTVPLPIVIGVSQSGHATLSSADPTRASNGEATTFVYQIMLHNSGTKRDSFLITAKNVPSSWEVTVPAGSISVGADEDTTFPVLLTVPFAHQHGSFIKFTVEAQSQSDPGTAGRIEIGIRYLAIPQPTGHHPKVWFHGVDDNTDPTTQQLCVYIDCGSAQVYMNAIEDDPAIPDPAKEPTVPGTLVSSGACSPGISIDCGSGGQTAQVTYSWFIDLQPALEMGIDLNMLARGDVDFPVGSTIPMNGAVLSGSIFHYDPAPPGRDNQGPGNFFGPSGNRTRIMAIGPSAAQDVAPNTPLAKFNATVIPLPKGDYIPYEKGASLSMQLNLTFTGVAPFLVNDGPFWAKGGDMLLPVSEYHDKLAESFSLPALAITADGSIERATNVGKTVLFNTTISNQENRADSFVVSLAGPEKDWARVLGPTDITLAGYQHFPLHVAVAVPKGAHVGDRGSVLVKVANAADANEAAFLQLHVVVDDQTHADEAGQADSIAASSGKHKTPAPSMLVLGAALVLAVVVGRRRWP